jgi:D-amino-acid dehydrogenase
MQRTSPRVNGMKKSISRAYPAFRPDVLAGDVWCGLRPCSPDGMPYLGRTKKISNMIVSAGHAMMGMSLGPVSGRLVADSLRGGPSIHELDPDRFA